MQKQKTAVSSGVAFVRHKHCKTGRQMQSSFVAKGALFGALMACHSAWAQEATGVSGDKVLPMVVIEGSQYPTREETGYKAEGTRVGKTKQNPKDIPQAVTVITEQLMHDRNAATLREALRNVAGVTFNAGEGGRIGDNITLRGYSAVSDLYLDNMRDAAQYNRDTFNLEQIDVLKGSSSMLFGRGSTGGVINQVSKTAKPIEMSEVNLTGGSNDYRRVTADLNTPITDKVAFRLNFMNLDAGSYRKGADFKSTGIAPTFSIGAGTENELNFSYYYLNTNNTPDYGVPYFKGKPIDVPLNRWYGLSTDYEKNLTQIWTGDYKKTFENGATWKTTVRHAQYDRDLRAVAPRLAGGVTSVSDSTVLNRQRQARGAKEETTAVQSDFAHNFKLFQLDNELLAGVEYLSEQATRWNNTSSIANPSTTVGNPTQPTLPANFGSSFYRVFQGKYTGGTYSAYIQDTLRIAPKWKMMAGLRYDKLDADYVNASNRDWNRTDKEFSNRFGLIYEPSDNSTVYVSYSTGFNPSAELYQLDTKGSNIPPEKTRNMEVGAKWNLLNNRLSTRVSLSRSEKTNERNTDLANPDIALLSGKRHTDALELEANGRITNDWEVFANYAYMKAKVDVGVGQSAGYTGKVPPNTPRSTASVWSTYHITPKFKVGTGVEYVGSRYATDDNATEIDAYTRVDALAEYSFNQHVALKLNIFNLFNKGYYEGIYRGHVLPGTDRAGQLTLTFKF